MALSAADGVEPVSPGLSWLQRQGAALAAPTAEATMREEQPLLVMLAWSIIIWAILRQAMMAVKQLALPGLQACGIQLLAAIACNALAATFQDQVSRPGTYQLEFGFLDRFSQGIAMLIACVILPRRVVCCYMPHLDLRRHYLRKLQDFQPRGARKRRRKVALTDNCEDSDVEELLADSVQRRSQMVLWFGRTSAVLLMVVRPILASQLLDMRWWISHAVVDTLILIVCTIMVWAAGNELTKEILHKVLPKYRQLAFLVTSMVWAFHLQHLFCMSRGSQQEFLRNEHKFLMLDVLHVGEVAFVVFLAADFLCPSRDPLVQLARLRLGAQESFEDEEASELGGQGLRWKCCRLCRAFCDLRRPLRELLLQGLPWPLQVESEEDMEESDESDSEAMSEATRCSPEASVGKEAWSSWAAASGVHPAWFGSWRAAHGRISSRPGRSQLEPELSPEDNFKLGNALISHNSWWRVPADLFTDRVRSKFLAVVMVVILVVTSYSHNVFDRIIGEFANPVEALGVQLCGMTALWVLFGVLVFGNNAFVSYKSNRRWIVFMGTACLGLAFYTSQDFASRPTLLEGGGALNLMDVIADVQRRYTDVSVCILSFLACFLAVNLYLSPEDSNDFHHCEFNALWYTSNLLESNGPVRSLRRCPPQAGEQLFFRGRGTEGLVKALVDKDHGDGTCDVTLADGRRLVRERHKFFRRSPQRGPEETLDEQLGRLKALHKASEDYPAVLYLGAISSMPLLLALACGVLLAVRTLLHKVYRLHIYCSLLSFWLNAMVVPPGPAGESPAAREALITDMVAWRLGGGLGLADAEHMPHVANVSGLNYILSEDNSSESMPCSQLKQGHELVVLLGLGYDAEKLHFQLVDLGITHTLRVLWGIDEHSVEVVSSGLRRLWAQISGGDPDFVLNAAGAGQLLCEAKLLSSVRLKTAGRGVRLASQRLAASLALNVTRELEERLETVSCGWPVVGPVLAWLRGQSLALLGELRALLDEWANGDAVASAQAMGAIESGVEHSAPFLTAAAHLAEGKPPDVQTVISLVDSDGNGKVSLTDEAPGLVDLGMKLCWRAGCGHTVESSIWEALAYADRDGDGELSQEDIKSVGKALKDSFKSGRRLLQGICGTRAVPAAAAGETVGAAGMAVTVPKYEELLQAFDANGDGSLALQEVMSPITKMLPDLVSKVGGSLERAALGEVLSSFRRADSDGDGRVSIFEASLGGFASAVSKLCPAPQPGASEAALGTDATARSLQGELKDEAEVVIQSARVNFGHFGGVILSVIGALANDAIGLMLIGLIWVLYLALLCAAVCQLYVIGRCFSRYRELFESMQSGRHSYVGRSQRSSLERGFSQTTLFPGMLFGTTFFGFLFVTALVFFLLVFTLVLCLPCWAGFWQRVYPVLIYLGVAFCLKEFISFVVMDMWLAEEGEIIYPGFFSLFWFIQLFLNFLLGLSTACFRSVLVLVWAVVSCCFVDFTLLSESLVMWDSAYFSLLTMAYTHHIQRNPVKKAMVTSLFRHIQEVHCRTSRKEDSEELTETGRQTMAKEANNSTSFWRARARFWLVLTLHHNPELVHQRRRTSRGECE